MEYTAPHTENPAKETLMVPFRMKEDFALLSAGEFVGLASKTGNLIPKNGLLPPSIIETGAFIETILDDFSRIRVLLFHDDRRVVGKPVELDETIDGLVVRGRLATSTEDGQLAQALMREGLVDALSIGFDPLEFHFDEEGVRHVTQLKLWEISLVVWGADNKAFVTEFHGSESEELRKARRDLLISNLRRRRAETAARHAEEINAWQRELLEAEHSMERRAR